MRSGNGRPTLEFLTANDWNLIGHRSQDVNFAPEKLLIREAEPLHRIYVIRRGTVRIEVGGKRVAVLGEGAVCGEMAFLEGKSASASVIAEGEVVAQEIPAAELKSLFEMFPTLGLRFYKSIAVNLSRKLRDTSLHLADVQRQIQSPTGRGEE